MRILVTTALAKGQTVRSSTQCFQGRGVGVFPGNPLYPVTWEGPPRPERGSVGPRAGQRAPSYALVGTGQWTAFPWLGQPVPVPGLRGEEPNESWMLGAFLHISGIRAREAAVESPQPWHSRVRGRGLTQNPASTPTRVPPPTFLQRAKVPLHLLYPLPRHPIPPTLAPGEPPERPGGVARPFDVRRRPCDWTAACDVRGLRWARVLRQPQRRRRLGLRLPGI